MLVTRVNKEPPDITRIVVDMDWWLDPDETITQIVSSEVIQGMSGWSEAPYPPPGGPPPYDPTPLLLNSAEIDTTGRGLTLFVEFGTSGVAYTIQFILDGTSTRRITFEVGVQTTGVPPEQPMPLPPLPSDAAGQQPGDWYLNIKGGTMQGPLYLYQSPLYPTEAASKAYVDYRVSGGVDAGPSTTWSTVIISDVPPVAPGNTLDNTLWWDSSGTGLYIRYNDGNSRQWVASQNPYTLTDAPVDGNVYGRQSGAWTNLTDNSSTGPFLPIAGGTMGGPLKYKATGATTARSAQDRAAEGGLSVVDFGAKCDGITDDTAAFNAAIASGISHITIPAGVCCYLPNGIRIPSGITLEGLSYFANSVRTAGSTSKFSPPSSSILTNANINSVTLGSGLNLEACALLNIVIATNAASAPTAGAGVYVETGAQVRCENVTVYNAYNGFHWRSIAQGGIIGWMDLCMTDQISGHHVVQDSWPELRLNLCRFTGTYGAKAYVFMTGGQPSNILPNGHFATNCQYNENGPSVGAVLSIGDMVAGAEGSAQEFHFINCHAEHYDYAVKTDATVLWLMKVKFIGCGLFSQGAVGQSDFFNIDPATTFRTQIQVIGNDIEVGTFTMTGGVWYECQIVGNNIGCSDFTNGVKLGSTQTDSTLSFEANGIVGNLTLSGVWGGLVVDATIRGGTLTNTAAGKITVNVPGFDTPVFTAPNDATSLQSGSASFKNFAFSAHYSAAYGQLALGQAADAAINNTAFGSLAGYGVVTGDNNTLIGSVSCYGPGNPGMQNTTALGYATGYGMTTGTGNTLIGCNAGNGLTTGSGNILITDGTGGIISTPGDSHTMRIGTNAQNLIRATNIDTAIPKLFLDWLPASTPYANDAAAAAGGVQIGQLYRTTTSQVMVRVS